MGSPSSFWAIWDFIVYVLLVLKMFIVLKKIHFQNSNESGAKEVFRPSPNLHRDLTLDDHLWRGLSAGQKAPNTECNKRNVTS